MTRLEIMKLHKAEYEEYSKKIINMTGLTKLVAENLVLEWIKGNKWMGGLSDRKAQTAYEKLFRLGYSFEEIDDEFNKQINSIMANNVISK